MNVFDKYGDSEENRQIRESMEEQEQREEQKRFEHFLKDNSLITLKYVCSKEESHNLTYILFIEGEYIRKIGQYPFRHMVIFHMHECGLHIGFGITVAAAKT